MHVIIQGHGFNSGPGSKAASLQAAFPNAQVIAPQLPYEPSRAYSILEELMKSHLGNFVQFVGTSLGGFYGLCLSADFYKSQHLYYLINTTLQPQIQLERYLHSTVTNFKTMERRYIDSNLLDEFRALYRRMYAGINGRSIQQLRIFEGVEDEIIDHSQLRQFLKSYESPVQISTHERDHRFEDITPVIESMKIDAEAYLSANGHY